jgi:hypothetical protein
MELTIEMQPMTGLTVGYFTRSLTGEPDKARDFSPAVDPSHGYPVELAPSEYAYFRMNGVAGRPYTLFDGNISGDHFSAWFSYRELWSDWCALQKPTRIQVDGEARNVCAPNIHDETVDLGKRVLCTSADMDSFCSAKGAPADMTPCVCTMDSEAGNPLCSPNYCRCDATQCDADLWSGAQWFDLTLTDGQLVGTWFRDNQDTLEHVVLARVTP